MKTETAIKKEVKNYDEHINDCIACCANQIHHKYFHGEHIRLSTVNKWINERNDLARQINAEQRRTVTYI